VANPFEIEFLTAVKEGELGALGGEDGNEELLLSRFEDGTGGVGVFRAALVGTEDSLAFPLPESSPRSLWFAFRVLLRMGVGGAAPGGRGTDFSATTVSSMPVGALTYFNGEKF
jgi:hypothetical protein